MPETSEFHLRISEGYCADKDWGCWQIKRLHLGHNGRGLLIRVEPPLSGGECGSYGFDTPYLLISPRFGTDSLIPFSEWPLEVRVFALKVRDPDQRDSVTQDEIINIGFGTIYGLDQFFRMKKKLN